MHNPKTLWNLARGIEGSSRSPWVSASRDSDVNLASFKTWLASLPIDSLAPCFIINGPHSATSTTWKYALNLLLSVSPESGEIFVLGGELKMVLTLARVGIARFTIKSAASHEPPQS